MFKVGPTVFCNILLPIKGDSQVVYTCPPKPYFIIGAESYLPANWIFLKLFSEMIAHFSSNFI
jgi:hypothetical protein